MRACAKKMSQISFVDVDSRHPMTSLRTTLYTPWPWRHSSWPWRHSPWPWRQIHTHLVNGDRWGRLTIAININSFEHLLSNTHVCSRQPLISFRADDPGSLPLLARPRLSRSAFVVCIILILPDLVYLYIYIYIIYIYIYIYIYI